MVEIKEASQDKSAHGIYEDIKDYLKEDGFPLPIITDNCATMVNLTKYSSHVFKIFCLEHKLSRIEIKLHKNLFFKRIDDKLTLINAYFSYRHGKYELNLKPLTSFSNTRPWRSNKLNYKTFIANYDSYIQISKIESNFPDIPLLNQVEILYNFEIDFCKNFDILEKRSSDLLDGISVYFNLIALSRNSDYQHLDFEKIIVDELYPIVFSPIACCYYYLSRVNFISNSNL